jgi:DNA-binding response OmpR family regulator
MSTILLAEDDTDFGSILKQYLELHGYGVHWYADGATAWAHFQKQEVDICVLDVMMPELDGFSLAEKMIALKPETPFVFSTARGQKEDKIKGLKLGADDYIVKPFEAEELVWRLRNIVKRSRSGSPTKTEAPLMNIGGFAYDGERLELKGFGHTQRLTEKEGRLLAYLYKNKNRLIKREEILKALWANDDFFSGRSMDVFISRLRKYLAHDPEISIQSIRGLGLEFRVG